MSTRSLIISQIQQVATEQKKTLAPLTDDLSLLDSGLDSLCFAILVSRLEDEIGVDPFTSSQDGKFPNTVGELIAFYEHATV
jgi:acyl carrier protein